VYVRKRATSRVTVANSPEVTVTLEVELFKGDGGE
jgi:hypothetical protein